MRLFGDGVGSYGIPERMLMIPRETRLFFAATLCEQDTSFVPLSGIIARCLEMGSLKLGIVTKSLAMALAEFITMAMDFHNINQGLLRPHFLRNHS